MLEQQYIAKATQTWMLVSRPHPRLFQPNASTFIIALKCQPCLHFVNYLGGSS